jgi:hypothetical protein
MVGTAHNMFVPVAFPLRHHYYFSVAFAFFYSTFYIVHKLSMGHQHCDSSATLLYIVPLEVLGYFTSVPSLKLISGLITHEGSIEISDKCSAMVRFCSGLVRA